MTSGLNILCPKRNKRLQTGWEGFFPYYAGFPELFARELLESAGLQQGAVVLDPWNGSGTTTYTASTLGLRSIGIDINPVMIVVARARLLAPTEADHLRPLAASILSQAKRTSCQLSPNDALLAWFTPRAAAFIRAVEENIRRSLVGNMTRSADGIHLDRISGTAATMYVALFGACRRLVAPYQSSNPTWLRVPKEDHDRIDPHISLIGRLFGSNVRGMAYALAARQHSETSNQLGQDDAASNITLADTAEMQLHADSVDFVLTSPPYCTRIDYTAATRIELAVLEPLLTTSARSLGRKMIGSTLAPAEGISVDPRWGNTCITFLDALYNHKSKASKGYYYKTHLDYFAKMSCSLRQVAQSLKPGGTAVLVVQDSYYKEIHNDLSQIISEISAPIGLALTRREDFRLRRSLSHIHPGRKNYVRAIQPTETVLCFQKEAGNA